MTADQPLALRQVPDRVVVRENGRTHSLAYRPGDTLLETMLQGGVPAPFACTQGICATCAVRILKGEVVMRLNWILTDENIRDGYALACQGVPSGTECEIEIPSD